ncbi:unnamed protein product [Sympodiomycopsis kandeliae]
MFYSDVILSKRGPLGKVWLAAHFERKLNKTAFLQTNIENSVSAIVEQRASPMALRLSGQLLLGVVRIYSRKAKYLLDDCTDALLKIKMAFRAGAVDMTSDQLAVNANTITLPQAQTDIGILLPDAGMENWDAELRKRGDSRTPSRQRRSSSANTPGGGKAHIARASDITLSQTSYDAYDDQDPYDVASSGMGIASGEFDPDGGLDLGLDLFGDNDDGLQAGGQASSERRDTEGRLLDADGNVIGSEDRDDLSSIGVGRDAGSEMGGRQPSILGGDADITMGDFGGDGVDFGLGDDSLMSVGGAAGVMNTPGDQILQLDDLTPRTKQKVEEAAQRQAADAAAKAAKGRKQIEDRYTELIEDQGRLNGKRTANDTEEDDDLAQGNFLPRSGEYAKLLEIHKDPASQFAGGILGKEKMGRLFVGSDLNLAPELSNLFVVDLAANRAAKRARYQIERQQREGQQEPFDDLSVEAGRRALAEQQGGVDFFGEGMDDTFGLDQGANQMDTLGMDEFPDLTVGGDVGDETSLLRKSDRVKAQQIANEQRADDSPNVMDKEGILAPLSRFSTPSAEDDGNQGDDDQDLESTFTPSTTRLLAAFDSRPNDAMPEDRHLAASLAAEDASASQAASKTGFSKNTIRAQRVIRSQLKKDTSDEPSLSLHKVGENASRRAAAGFFFELLVLGTKDQIKLQQDEPYGDVTIQAKAGLWE